jgi:hypothetical protein
MIGGSRPTEGLSKANVGASHIRKTAPSRAAVADRTDWLARPDGRPPHRGDVPTSHRAGSQRWLQVKEATKTNLCSALWRGPPTVSEPQTSPVVRPGRGAVRPGRHHATEDKIQPRGVTIPPPTRSRSRGHHHVPTRTRALRPAERTGATVVHLTRAACKTTPVARGDGRSKAITVPQAPQGSRAWRSSVISYALSGPAVYHHTSRPYSPARPRAAWILPPTSLTEFARLRHSLLLRASRLPGPTTLAGCGSSWRNSRAKWLPCLRPKHADALVTTAAAPQATHLFVTFAGTTDVSGTRPVNATLRVQASRETPPAVVKGGKLLLHQFGPPLRKGPSAQTALSGGHWVRPVRLPTEAPSRTQGTHSLHPICSQRDYHPDLWMDLTESGPWTASRLHMAIRGSRRAATHNRRGPAVVIRPSCGL